MSYRFTDGYVNFAPDGYIRISSDGYSLITSDGYNIAFFVQGGNLFDTNAKGILYIPIRTSAPTSNPIGGGFLSSDGYGDGYWRNTQGLVQTFTGSRIVRPFPSDADYTAVQADYQAKIMEFTGALTGTRNIFIPIVAGYQWTVFNNTSGGQSVTFIGTTGTGITVTNGKRAIIYADGTNIVRVTPDT